jgi:prephenate dehydrogenase
MAFEPFNKVALVGLGLIGSSLSHVMRREGLAERRFGLCAITADAGPGDGA